ncbi:hypothetical protein FRACYDRAFT_261794 [Fragilariopsis cylindrus CCMP1102]|uniref:SGNH hydrolase-type esterase domain-containing protein n=1 Tax=Fragilariopsis cylindrus CCMP1102 TaxID=635003 RepID=A0A1E7FC10_9STRA|nr:hypothetical protein FRACYDRAFT_261794 [Fragilariopsis cylindrus CCMP1102]|eukprot:OEU15674.1 hypothetical protein FRACYDRAFT_261794 [Fragilariopsis cylindrus CCMP1102]
MTMMPTHDDIGGRNDRNTCNDSHKKIDSARFYGQYHGHPVRDGLDDLLSVLRESCDSLIWTAGDSSLDNKYWFDDKKPAVGAYRTSLEPPISNADVTYWLNYLADERATTTTTTINGNIGREVRCSRLAAINTAVEATTVNERTRRLREQDVFVRDNIQPEDILVVSVGGNDVAMSPSLCTILSMLFLVNLPYSCLENACVCGTMPCDEHCWGCGPVAMLSCSCAFPPCLGYMNHLFGTRVQKYIEKLVTKTKPKKILVCMIYYLDENPTPSWAGNALKCLGYDSNPKKLQCLMQRLFVEATSKININGTEVIPVPLFNVLDGKIAEDYVARVEPSSQGGRKMAEFILDIIEKSSHHVTSGSSLLPVESTYMADRS